MGASASDKELREGNSRLVEVRIWRTARDSGVRKTSKSDHTRMEGVTLSIQEEFDLGSGVKARCPGNSGSASNDIHCRCYLSYDLVHNPKYVKVIIKQTGGKYDVGHWEWVQRREEEAEKYYQNIRNRHDDIDKISKNTGWNRKSITKIKNHVFYDKHTLEYKGYDVFDADYNMSVAWQRLINGNYLDRDILLLKHEYLESIIEKKYNISNHKAHEKTTLTTDWSSILDKETGGKEENDYLNELIGKE